MSKRKILIIIAAVLIITIFISLVLINQTHTVNPKLIMEYTLDEKNCDIYGENGYCYFFVQNNRHYCFNGDGIEEFKMLVPKFDFSTLDLHNYNYIVAINCEINSLSYSYKTAYKTMSVGINTYIANANLTKTHDNSVRIYTMKSVNIDYDFFKYGSPGTDFDTSSRTGDDSLF